MGRMGGGGKAGRRETRAGLSRLVAVGGGDVERFQILILKLEPCGLDVGNGRGRDD